MAVGVKRVLSLIDSVRRPASIEFGLVTVLVAVGAVGSLGALTAAMSHIFQTLGAHMTAH